MIVVPIDFADREAAARRIAELSDEEYEQVRQVLIRLEIQRLMDDVGKGGDEAFPDGDFSSVAESITEYRRRNPYQ